MANSAIDEGHVPADGLKAGMVQEAYNDAGQTALILEYDTTLKRYVVRTPAGVPGVKSFAPIKATYPSSARKLFMEKVVENDLHFPDAPQSDAAVTADLSEKETGIRLPVFVPEEEGSPVDYEPTEVPVTETELTLYDLAQRFRNRKEEMFAERDNVNEILDWAMARWPDDKPAAVTVVMMTYNTILEYVARSLIDEMDDEVLRRLQSGHEEHKES